MATKRKIAAARANGAKSRGPITPEGKSISSMNGLRHGLRASALIIDGETPDAFEALQTSIVAALQPEDFCELKIVEIIVMCYWRLTRMWQVERTAVNRQIRNNPVASPSTAPPQPTQLWPMNPAPWNSSIATKIASTVRSTAPSCASNISAINATAPHKKAEKSV